MWLTNNQNKNVVSVKGGCLEGLDWKSAIHIWYATLPRNIHSRKGRYLTGRLPSRTKSAMVPIPEGVESHKEDCKDPEDYGVCQEELDEPPGGSL